MKQKIAILGSTGSIGKSLLNIINRDKNNFQIILLSANKNYKKLLHQAKLFDVKNLLISDKKIYLKLIKLKKYKKINFFNSYNDFHKIFKSKKLDYIMSAITGIEGLDPTLKSIKYTKKIAIANKEAIICGWNLIYKSLKKYKVKFIPIDSEHFSIWYGSNENSINNVSKVYLTASGGPFLKKKINKLNTVNISSAIKHPNWKMGKKISIDSATMMNKVFEIIEARNIFNLPLKKLSILVHPKSYIHAIIKFNSGLIKLIAHDTTMEIPIFNSIYMKKNKIFKSNQVNLKLLNNLKLQSIDKKRFKVVKILDKLNNKNSLFETILVSANDAFVDLFLKKRIKFLDISTSLLKFLESNEFKKYKKIYPKNVNDILKLNDYVRLKILSNVYKYQR